MFGGRLRTRQARIRQLSDESLKDYKQLYLVSDICLLADVFQMFRNNSLDEYQLDPAYFVSAPTIAWNALLKHIDRTIPLITDPEMY